MKEDFATSHVDVADLMHVLMMLTIEIVAAVKPSKEADIALEDIANRLLETGQKTSNERTGTLLRALAYQLMGTEEGA